MATRVIEKLWDKVPLVREQPQASRYDHYGCGPTNGLCAHLFRFRDALQLDNDATAIRSKSYRGIACLSVGTLQKTV
jgi:hypothetical protein